MRLTLGPRRCRLLSCSWDALPLPQRFESAKDDDLHTAAQRHFEACLLVTESYLSAPVQNIVRALGAAGLLTYGYKEQLIVILEQLPHKEIVLDHGAGYCWVIPFVITAGLLPLPSELCDSKAWIAGSTTALQLQQWIAEYIDQLQWDNVTEQFTLAKFDN